MTTLPTIDLIAGYRPSTDGHDELVDDRGRIRHHWSEIAEAFRSLGVGELARRHDEIDRLLEQDGVTYNVPDDSDRTRRTWALDPIPFILPGSEWAGVERGLIQRAELLDHVLADLYGERRLLRSGIIPPAMILADPQFLRACDGIRLPGERQLVLCGTDVARGADGTWVALGHRAQAPSGTAYALENRRVLSRVFPHVFRHTDVQRLMPFVQALRDALVAAAPADVDDPTIVILSPGSLSETAFEHASIAAQLGYPLVQGSDFELHEGRVGLRTVGGWTPVHVILRRVDAAFCDPLALRSDSTLGIPGLVAACRAGTVSVVNTLGSGILENAGLAGLMAALSKHVLGSDLIMESAPSWWCGDPTGRSHVLADLGNLVVRPLSRHRLGHSIDTAMASADELDELRRRIDAEPDQWVGQERLAPASAPVLGTAGIEPRPTVLRSFVVAGDGSYVAMAGGLARSAPVGGSGPITNRTGATSKDIWVLGDGSGSATEVWPSGGDTPIAPPMGNLPARAAESFFWLGRYAERAEATVRLIRAVTTRCDEFLNVDSGPGPASLDVVLRALTHVTGTYPGFVGDHAAAILDDPTAELTSLVVDDRRRGTVAHAVRHMFDALDVVRDQLSVDTWLVVGSLQRELQRLEAEPTDPDSPIGEHDDAMMDVLSELLQGLLSLSGLANESMVRDLGWQFMEAGRRIERGINIATLVGSALETERSAPVESLVIESVLTAGESIITSRRRYRSGAFTTTTIDLLLADAGNPRSLRFQLDRLSDSLDALDGDPSGGSLSPARRLLDDVTALLVATDATQLAVVDDVGRRAELQRFVDSVRTDLAMISDAITAESFTRLHSQHAMIGPIDGRRSLDDSNRPS